MKTPACASLFDDRQCVFSPCRLYRYFLKIVWDSGKPRQVFIGLNPSTADENSDDPTVRRWLGFAKDWGMGGVVILNAYAFRSTDWTRLRYPATVEDPVGPDNDFWIEQVIAPTGPRPIACWGQNASKIRDGKRGEYLVNKFGPFDCLGQNADGSPCHPLYLRKDTEPRPWGPNK